MRLLPLLEFWLFSCVEASTWARIKLDPLVWEELSVSETGERRIYCGNFDQNTTHKYHWRFNSTSILPEKTQIHKHTFVFLKGSNALRGTVAGTYECCVKETLGKACYARELSVQNPPHQVGVDLSHDPILYAKEGDSYYIRLLKTKRIEGVTCTKDGENVNQNVKYPFLNSRKSKQSNYYHLRIEHFSEQNEGNYNCTVRVHKKVIETKVFRATLKEAPAQSSGSLSLPCFITVLLSFGIR